MELRGIIDEDFVNYKLPSMYLAFPYCDFKCEKECGIKCCQNSPMTKTPIVDISADTLVKRYLDNPISKSIVCAGLEPLYRSFNDVLELIDKLRKVCDDPVVIYTGYNEYEILEHIERLKKYKNIIIKFGRFIPNDEQHFDDCLGVKLASKNQFAKQIS